VDGMGRSVDPVTFEVIRNALTETTEEMSTSLRRSAYSTNIKTRADFSCALFDRDLRVIAQGFNQANHLGSLVQLVPQAIRDYGPENIRDGDAIITNDPYRRGGHLNDVTFISPVYRGTTLHGYVANVAHHVDVGGGAPASVGAFQEIFQEGVIIPPIKLVSAGEIVPDIFALVLSQIRSKRETSGDFRAQVAANHTGARRLVAILDRHGPTVVDFYVNELISYTERLARAGLSRIPKGVYTATGLLDSDGFSDEPVHLSARIDVDESGVRFDFTGCDLQRRAPVNSTYAMTFSACAYVLKCLMDPDIPTNDGLYRLVSLVAPEGTVVNCSHPAPVVGGWETHTRLVETIFKALSVGLPDLIPAGTKGMICHAGFGGNDPSTGEYYCFLETLAGGYGGRASSDGPDVVQVHGQNTENAPVEETEANYPVRILRYELVDDSEGAGRFRGGLGLRRDYLFPDSDATFTVLADRERWGPHGLWGGHAGAPSQYILNPDTENRSLGSKVTVPVHPGDVVSYRTSGGGGYGPPMERQPSAVLGDVRDGRVSVSRAREVYGVAIDPDSWLVEEDETAHLRESAASTNR
jgi:N-methylhydantoinase B